MPSFRKLINPTMYQSKEIFTLSIDNPSLTIKDFCNNQLQISQLAMKICRNSTLVPTDKTENHYNINYIIKQGLYKTHIF